MHKDVDIGKKEQNSHLWLIYFNLYFMLLISPDENDALDF